MTGSARRLLLLNKTNMLSDRCQYASMTFFIIGRWPNMIAEKKLSAEYIFFFFFNLSIKYQLYVSIVSVRVSFFFFFRADYNNFTTNVPAAAYDPRHNDWYWNGLNWYIRETYDHAAIGFNEWFTTVFYLFIYFFFFFARSYVPDLLVSFSLTELCA